jgi:hypothetical protein
MPAMAKDAFSVVRKAAQGFPELKESLYFGQPALKANGEMVVCMATHKSADAGSLVVRMDFERRKELLAEAPDVYYLTDHYVGYPSVVVRLSKVSPDALRGLLAGALDFTRRAAGKKRRSAK